MKCYLLLNSPKLKLCKKKENCKTFATKNKFHKYI